MEKIAVAIVHGVGKQRPLFWEKTASLIRKRFNRLAGNQWTAKNHPLRIRGVYWAPVLQKAEDELWKRLAASGPMDFKKIRRFMVDFAADAIAYQPAGEMQIYEKVHKTFSSTLSELADEAGPRAPLCIISHSLGTVISFNYIKDLQSKKRRAGTRLEQGKTLGWFFTMGSPIALWSLRFDRPLFGKPVEVPSPDFKKRFPRCGGWTNLYDKDDVIGYPLRGLNKSYAKHVVQDRLVNAGNIVERWNPLSHSGYWKNRKVVNIISESLFDCWKKTNQTGRI